MEAGLIYGGCEDMPLKTLITVLAVMLAVDCAGRQQNQDPVSTVLRPVIYPSGGRN